MLETMVIVGHFLIDRQTRWLGLECLEVGKAYYKSALALSWFLGLVQDVPYLSPGTRVYMQRIGLD
jgi:hypothetical protein